MLTVAISSAALSTCVATFARATEVSFDAPFTSYASAYRTVGVDIGDINADGKLDLVACGALVGSPSTGRIAVLLGQGDGTFLPRTEFVTGLSPTTIELGDLDGDQKLDAVTASYGSSTISVLMGVGDGTFGPPTDYATGHFSQTSGARRPVWIADFNSDQVLDVMVTEDTLAVSLFLGNGDGTLTRTIVPTNVPYVLFFASDVDTNGTLDLVYVRNNTVYAHLGNGDGTFAPASVSAVSTATYFCSDDVDGDDLPDIAMVSPSSIMTAVGNGDGTFDTGITSSSTTFGPDAFPVLVDFDLDGQLDFLTIHYGGGGWGGILSIHRNRADGTFDPPREYPAPWDPKTAKVADLDQDGKPDVVVTSRNGSSLAVYRGNGDCTVGGGRSYRFRDQPVAIAAGDVDGDSWPDLAAGYRYSTAMGSENEVQILLSNGAGEFLSGQAVPNSGRFFGAVALADVDNDEILDLLATDYSDYLGAYDSAAVVWLGNGDGTFGPPSTWETGRYPVRLETADLDRDGNLDLIVGDNGGISVLLGNGDGTFQPRLTNPTGSPNDLEVEDINGDQWPDVVVELSGSAVIPVLLGLGDGTFSRIDQNVSPSVHYLSVGDIDGDHVADLAYDNNTFAYLYHGIGDGTFTPIGSFDIGGETGYLRAGGHGWRWRNRSGDSFLLRERCPGLARQWHWQLRNGALGLRSRECTDHTSPRDGLEPRWLARRRHRQSERQ